LVVAHHIECDAYGIPDNPFGYEELICLASLVRASFSDYVRYKWSEFNMQVSLPSKFHVENIKARIYEPVERCSVANPSQPCGEKAESCIT
jgi:hypothetical protein